MKYLLAVVNLTIRHRILCRLRLEFGAKVSLNLASNSSQKSAANSTPIRHPIWHQYRRRIELKFGTEFDGEFGTKFDADVGADIDAEFGAELGTRFGVEFGAKMPNFRAVGLPSIGR